MVAVCLSGIINSKQLDLVTRLNYFKKNLLSKHALNIVKNTSRNFSLP